MICTTVEKAAFYLFAGYLVSSVAPALVSAITWRKQPDWLKPVSVYLSIIAIIEIAAYYVRYAGGSNLWLYCLVPLFEYALLAYAISLWHETERLTVNAIRASILVYIAYWAYCIIAMKTYEAICSAVFPAANICLLLLTLYSLIRLSLHETDLLRDTRAWTSMVVILYAAGDLLTNALTKYILHNMNEYYMIWFIHIGLNIAVNVSWVLIISCHQRHLISGGSG